MAVHGDIIEVAYTHATLGNGVFYPKAGESNTFDPGGFRNSDDQNAIAGNGDLIVTKNRVRASFEIAVENDMNIRQDLLNAKALAANPVSAQYTVTLKNGTVWTGAGIPVGDLQADTNTGLFTLKVASGEFIKL